MTGNNVTGDSTYKDVWEYDFTTELWTEIEEFPGSRRRYMVSFVIDNIAYAGSGTNGTNLKDFWAFQPLLNTSDTHQINISIGPNPSSEMVLINLFNKIGHVQIFDLSGRLVLEKIINDSLDVFKNELGSGEFILIISTGSQVVKEKIIFV